MLIRAALIDGAGAPVRLAEVELDEPREDEVVVRLAATGVSQTDVDLRAKWHHFPGYGTRFPLVLGREGAGVVEAAGANVSRAVVGQPVALSYLSCRTCARCRSGKPYACLVYARLNLTGARPDGSTTMREGGSPVYGCFFGQSSFASHALVHENAVVPLPVGTDLELAALLGGDVQVGAGTVLNTIGITGGGAVAVFGAGIVGLLAAMTARAVGVELIAVVDESADRRAAALAAGASHALDPDAVDAAVEIRRLSPGGAEGVVETIGTPIALRQALRTTAPGGTCVSLAQDVPEFPFSPSALSGGRRLTRTVEGEADPRVLVPRLARLIATGALPLDSIVRRYPFVELPAALADTAASSLTKALVVMGPPG